MENYNMREVFRDENKEVLAGVTHSIGELAEEAFINGSVKTLRKVCEIIKSCEDSEGQVNSFDLRYTITHTIITD